MPASFDLAAKNNTKVYFRVLPMEKMDWRHVKIAADRTKIYIRYLQELAKTKNKAAKVSNYWRFCVDYVFFNEEQSKIYNTIIGEVLESVVNKSNNAIITAFGQTGTGKSSTISGILHYSFEDRGILPRIIPDLFQIKTTLKKNVKMCVQISYIEVTRTAVKDLLKPFPNTLDGVKNTSLVKVATEEEALKYVFMGEGRKDILKDPSYASHCASSVFTFHITKKNFDMSEPQLVVSRLHVIDLAGVDTVGNVSCLFKKPRQIGSANLAKSQLEQLLLILNDGIPEHVKVKCRLNPMVQHLGSSLSNSSILRFIGHIRVAEEDLLVTVSMLRFGQTVSGLKSTKQETATSEKVQFLEKNFDKLKKEKTYSALLASTDLSTNLSEDRYHHVRRVVEDYLQDKIDELVLLNVADMRIALQILKENFKHCQVDGVKKVSTATSVVKLKQRSSTASLKLVKKSSGSSIEDKILLKGTKSSERSLSRESKGKSRGSQVMEGGKSLLKRSVSSKRNSSASVSTLPSRRDQTTSNCFLLPEIAPEYHEALNSYVADNSDEYKNFVDLHEINENLARSAYRTYMDEVTLLQEAMVDLEKKNSELLMAKMTRKYQQVDIVDENGDVVLSEFEEICLERLIKAQNDRTRLQELVLKCQTELKLYMELCKNIKKDFRNHFDEYCKTNFKMPVENLETEETIEEKVFVSEDNVEKSKAEMKISDNAVKFEEMRQLIEIERGLKDLYFASKNRKWVTN